MLGESLSIWDTAPTRRTRSADDGNDVGEKVDATPIVGEGYLLSCRP